MVDIPHGLGKSRGSIPQHQWGIHSEILTIGNAQGSAPNGARKPQIVPSPGLAFAAKFTSRGEQPLEGATVKSTVGFL